MKIHCYRCGPHTNTPHKILAVYSPLHIVVNRVLFYFYFHYVQYEWEYIEEFNPGY